MKYLLLILVLFSLIAACRKEYAESYLKTPDWTTVTHSDSVPPDYGTVFGEGKVLKFEITILQDDWKKMQLDLFSNIRTGNPPPPVNPLYKPVWVPCSFSFNGTEWYKVGIRYKGNSSLKECVRRNIRKYSFKLDFDQFEDRYPAIRNQRFYGFKQLNFANGFDDMSLMRDKTAADLFRDFGIPSARATFCEVWIDFGEGLKFFGLYTVLEEVEETVIRYQFNVGGNLYKPEGPAATFASGTYNTRQFDRQTNLDIPVDYSDIKSLYDIINSPTRISNRDEWKESLGRVFDVPHFMKWLAANTIMENWDSYGKMSHNYYLYNNPSSGKLTWIPWDHNEALRKGKQGGGISLSLSEVTAGWPLIRYLADDQEWYNLYRLETGSFITTVFAEESMNEIVDTQAGLIGQYARAEKPGYTFLSSPDAFDAGIAGLKQHCLFRINAAKEFIQKVW